VHRRRFRRARTDARQEVKELVRGTRDALGTGFLGSLESFLAYLQTLMHFCERFARDEAATAAMLVRRPRPAIPQRRVHCQCTGELAARAGFWTRTAKLLGLKRGKAG